MKRPALILAIAMVALPLLLIAYRILALGYPVLPVAPGRAWELSMSARVEPFGQSLLVEVALPRNQPQQIILNEEFISGSLEFGLISQPLNRTAVWTQLERVRQEAVGYRTVLLMRPREPTGERSPVLEDYPEGTSLEERTLARRLAAHWSQLEPGARLRAVAGSLINDWGSPSPEPRDLREWSASVERTGEIRALLVLLRAVNLPARPVEGFRLTDSARAIPFKWIQVWTGKQWDSLLPETRRIVTVPGRLLPLSIGGAPVLRVRGGRLSEVRWSVLRSTANRWEAHLERIRQSNRWLDQWSLFKLPEPYQITFRIILLVPIGALLVSVLRNVVGFITFGTFMPVLIALAFRNTGLGYGLSIFAFVIALGYFLRRAVDGLHLLLVPRLSLLLTLVIAFLTALALVGSHVGIREFMAVGLLPIVILTMVIERFFIVVEEAGAAQAFQTAAGSAVVAAIIYGLIQWDALQITFFVYPELIFVVAACQLLLGRYTGMRLSEWIRFRELGKPS